MTYTKLLFVFVLFTSYALGMEPALKKLKCDVLSIKYSQQFTPEMILFAIQQNDPKLFTEDRVKDFLKQGISLDTVDANGDTVLCKAILTSNKDDVEMLVKCGASIDYSYARCMWRHHFVENRSYYSPDYIEKFIAKLWFNLKRKQWLMTSLLSMRRMGYLPAEMRHRILADCPEEIPSYCLKAMYSAERAKKIKEQRKEDIRQLYYKFNE